MSAAPLTTRVELEWINHAGFVLRGGTVSLAVDPWLAGRAFNESWELISPTRFSPADFRRVTHVWLSHEHPDHFSPPSLSSIPVESRRALTVLYQTTRDRRVVDYCRRLSFGTVHELSDRESYPVAPGFELQMGRAPNATDSWLHAKIGPWSILNLNDCVLSSSDHLRRVRERVGTVDVLLTQFSYACWVGNRPDVAARRQAGRQKLEEVLEHIRCFSPRYVLPFASFVWFCHKDNLHMNDSVNRIRDVVKAVTETGASPVVLYPGDRWGIGRSHEPGAAVARYEDDWRRVTANPVLTDPPPVDWTTLCAAAEAFRRRGLARNWGWRLRRFAPFVADLTDLGLTVRFSYRDGLSKVGPLAGTGDLALTSQFLKYAFDFDWGFGTLSVSGCFEKAASFRNVEEYAWVAQLNNQGLRLRNPLARALKKLSGK